MSKVYISHLLRYVLDRLNEKVFELDKGDKYVESCIAARDDGHSSCNGRWLLE